MRTIPLIVLAMVTALLFSGLAGMDSNLSSGTNTPVITYQPAGGSGYINYTIYSPQGTFYRSMMMDYLNESRIGTVSYGSLIQASVPVNILNNFMKSMDILKKNFKISYFQDSKSLLFQPFSSPAQMEVPFAYIPSGIALAYGYNAAYASGLNGKGETIAIVDAFGDPTIKYDVMAFDEIMNLPPINLSLIYPPGSGGIQQANASWALETATDVEWAHAMAPDAHINLIIASDASNGLLNAVSYAISNRLGNIISLSWGTPETELGTQAILTSSAVFQQAQNANITVFAASGDLGAYDGTSQLTVNFPSSDPYVTGVGGTALYQPTKTKGWTQSAWGGTVSGISYGSGGGFSTLPAPYWQFGPGINSTMHKRGVPDVSMVASVNTGVEIIQGGVTKEVGGTSVGTPMWAAIGALLDQATGKSMGTINPLLYQISRTGLYKSALTQITSGNNGYYYAVPGWNPVTGLGTPVVGNLINDSKEIMGTYGTVAIINSSGYNSTSVAANITLGGDSSQNDSSGSSYYYVSEYSSSENFVKAGVSDLNGTYSAEYRIEQNGVLVSGSDPLPNMSGKTVPLSLVMRGTNITASAGDQSFSLNYLLSFSGDYHAAFGAEITGSEYNLTNLTGAYFSNVTVANGSNRDPVSSVYMERYSQIPSEQNYSSIQLSHYGSQYNVSYAVNGFNHFINGTAISDTSITYSLAYNGRITGTFALNSGGSASWNVSGHSLSGNTYPFTEGGYYNITATVNSNHVYSMTIHIPSLFSTSITVRGYYTATYSPVFSGVLDNFYGTGPVGLNKTTVNAIYGANQLELSGNGFYSNSIEFTAGHNATITMQPVYANLSIFVFQGNSTVEVNGNNVRGNNGIYAVTLDPGKANISVSSTGYIPYYLNMSLLPAENRSIQIDLAESGNNPIISGTVSDYNFGFGLQGVNVSVSNTTFFSFTNSSGAYYVQSPTGNHTLNYSRDLYMPRNRTFIVSTNATINVRLSPTHVEVFNFNLNIEKYFPLLFFTLYIQWSPYSGTGFSYYEVSVSSTTSFSPGTVDSVIVSNQGQNSMFFTGIYPGNTYYVALSIHLDDGSVYSTNYVTVSYSNPVFLFANLVIIGGTAFIIGVLLWTVAGKKDRWKF
jgi:subtilase family serine protease